MIVCPCCKSDNIAFNFSYCIKELFCYKCNQVTEYIIWFELLDGPKR